jgi:hypothetical protein
MIIRGPAVIKRGTQVLYTEGNITVTPNRSTFDVNTAMFGKIDDRDDSFYHEIGFTPAGICSAAYFDALYPAAYKNPVIGTSVFGDDLIIWTADGKQLTLKRSAQVTIPSLNFAADKPIFGEVKYEALGALDEDWDTAGHFASVSSVVFSDTTFDPSLLKTLIYAAAFGEDTPWDSFETEAGITIDFDLGLSEVKSDKHGLVDKTITGLSITAKCTPHGITEEQMLAAMNVQGTGAGRGQSIYRNAKDLSLTAGSGNPYFTLKNAAINTAPMNFGAEVNRSGEVEFKATHSIFTAGAQQALFELGITA